MEINIYGDHPTELETKEIANDIIQADSVTSISHIDQDLKSDIDQYIEKNEGSPHADRQCCRKRVQQQTVRFDDEAPLQVNTPIAMLIPRAVHPSRRDVFMGFDDCTVPPNEFDIYPQYKESFAACMRKYLIRKNLDDILVYKNANLSQMQWTAIINNKEYKPGKSTAVAIALALQLDMEETMDLLLAAGLELSHSHVFDLIIEYSINNELYDVFEVNEILSEFRQPLLC